MLNAHSFASVPVDRNSDLLSLPGAMSANFDAASRTTGLRYCVPMWEDASHLFCDFPNQSRMVVAHDGAELSRGQIQNFVAVSVLECAALCFGDEAVGIGHGH